MIRIAIPLLLAATAVHASITGILVDELGKPVAGATIRAYAAEDNAAVITRLRSANLEQPAIGTATSAENGSFKVDVKALLDDLVIESAATRPRSVEAADGQDLHVIVLRPKSDKKIRLTSGGKPLANAIVAAGALTVRTDDTGMVQMPDAPGRLVVLHPAIAPFAGFVGGQDFGIDDVPLNAGVPVRGRVLAADGQPVANATVSIGGLPLAQSAADGTFAIEHAPSGWRRIVATDVTRAGFAEKSRAASFDIRLRSAASVTGTTTPGARVELSADGDSDISFRLIADAAGKFASSNLPAGSYAMSASRPGFISSRTQFTLVPGAHVTRALPLQSRTLVRGRVVDEAGQPVAGAFVGAGFGLVSRETLVISGSNGEFAVPVDPHDAQWYAVKAGYAMGTGPAKNNTTLTLPRGFPLVVHVVDAHQKNVPEAVVNFMRGAQNNGVEARIELACEQPLVATCRTTNDAGTVNLRATEGQHSVNVRGASIVVKRMPVVALTAKSSPMTIEVDRGVEVSGRVLYSDRTPFSDGFVGVRGFGGSAGARTEKDGSFVLRNVRTGKVALVASTMGQTRITSAPLEVEAPARGVIITVPLPARIEGRALDKDSGQPIADFQVAVNNNGFRSDRPMTVHSDDGTYAMDSVQAGPVTLQFTASGYAQGSLTDLTAEEGKTLRAPDVKLEQGGSIRGRVTADGDAVAAVNVRFGEARGRNVNGALTDDNGEYVIEGLAAGDRTLEFQKEGFVFKRASVEVTKGKEARLDVELDRGKQLHGRVVDKSGQPVAGARVSARTATAPVPVRPSISDASGEFVLEGLTDGHYMVQAAKQGYVAAQESDVTIPSSATLTLTLDSGGSITGRITGLSSSDLAAAQVNANSRGSFARATPNSDGTFVLRGVADGTVSVSAMVRNGVQPRQSIAQSVEVVNGTAPAVQIDFNQGLTISGHVTRNGSPVTMGFVSFGGKENRGAMIQADGSYSVEGLLAGDYRVTVQTTAGNVFQSKYTVVSNSTYDIQLQNGSLRGRVVDATTGAGVSDISIITMGAPDNPVMRRAVSDSDGRFVLDAVPDGAIEVRTLASERYGAGVQSVTVRGGTAPDIELRLDSAQAVVFHITDAQSGQPMDAVVTISDTSGKPVGQSRGARDSDGGMRVYVSSGSYRAFVFARGYVGQRVEFSAPGPEVRVALQPSGGLVLIASKATHVRLVRADAAGPGGGVFIATPSGTPVLNLEPGTYRADVLTDDNKTVVRSVTAVVISGQQVTVNVE